MKSFILLLIFCISVTARANYGTKGGDYFKVGSPWSNQVISKKYYGKVGLWDQAVAYAFDKTPVGMLQWVSAWTPPFSQKVAENIAYDCQQEYAEFPWQQIHCASISVKFVIAQRGHSKFSTGCESKAEGFRRVFMSLNLPRSSSFFWDTSNKTSAHVVNYITVRGVNGVKYSYVLDVGLYASTLHPLSASAKQYHDRNGDDFSENQELPELIL